MRHVPAALAVAVAALLVTTPALAGQAVPQQTPPVPSPGAELKVAEPCQPTSAARDGNQQNADAPPDIELTATISMKSLRFETVGKPALKFEPQSPTSVCLLDHNLPTPIEPNRTYTDVVLRLLIRTSVADIASQQRSQP